MDVPAGFKPFPNQGPYLEYIGPIHVNDSNEISEIDSRPEVLLS